MEEKNKVEPSKVELSKADLAKLFKDVEGTGFARKQVDLTAQVFKGQEKFYGATGSERRREFSKKFSQLKRSTLNNYRE